MIKLRSVHSIHSQWKSKRMLATYMRRMRNNKLEIRIAGSSCRTQYNNNNLYKIERFSYDLEMKTRKQNRNNRQTKIERFDWFIERI